MCFVNAKGIAAYKEESRNEVCPQKTYSFWKPLSLEFVRPQKESQFRNVTYPLWYVQDLVAHCLVMPAGPYLYFTMRDVLPMWYIILWMFFTLVFAPVHVYIYLRHRHVESFAQKRFWSVLFIRLGIPLVFIVFGFFVEAPVASVSAIFVVILTKSPLANVFFCSLVHRVEFRQHVFIQAIAFVESLLWIPPFCRTCASSLNVKEKLNEMGYGIDWFFSYTFLNTTPDPASYPCWMISAMVMATLGFCIPTLLVFVTEVFSRAMFVKSRVSHKAHFALYTYTTEAIKVGFLAFLVVLVGTWFLLTQATQVLY